MILPATRCVTFCFVVNYLFVIHVFPYLCIGSCVWNERILGCFQHVWILWLKLNMWFIQSFDLYEKLCYEKNFICTCTYVTIVRFYYLVLHLNCIFICTSMLNVIFGYWIICESIIIYCTTWFEQITNKSYHFFKKKIQYFRAEVVY